ncbi:hypothetical protein DFH29DRAFT_1034636 [Suillus ampliporus]|nr:hypothetical protein DFH29DRAFT_1034636 [Suillus ampliporus]
MARAQTLASLSPLSRRRAQTLVDHSTWPERKTLASISPLFSLLFFVDERKRSSIFLLGPSTNAWVTLFYVLHRRHYSLLASRAAGGFPRQRRQLMSKDASNFEMQIGFLERKSILLLLECLGPRETSGSAARELKRRHDQSLGVGKDVLSPYAITAFVNQRGKQMYRVSRRDAVTPVAAAEQAEQMTHIASMSTDLPHSRLQDPFTHEAYIISSPRIKTPSTQEFQPSTTTAQTRKLDSFPVLRAQKCHARKPAALLFDPPKHPTVDIFVEVMQWPNGSVPPHHFQALNQKATRYRVLSHIHSGSVPRSNRQHDRLLMAFYPCRVPGRKCSRSSPVSLRAQEIQTPHFILPLHVSPDIIQDYSSSPPPGIMPPDPLPETSLHLRYSTEVFDVLQTYRGPPHLDRLFSDSAGKTTIKMMKYTFHQIWMVTVSRHVPTVRIEGEGMTTQVLIAATIEPWIAQVTSDLDDDELLNFFLTYRTYISAVHLCHLLICRFHRALSGEHDIFGWGLMGLCLPDSWRIHSKILPSALVALWPSLPERPMNAATVVERAVFTIATVKAFNAATHEICVLAHVLRRVSAAADGLAGIWGLTSSMKISLKDDVDSEDPSNAKYGTFTSRSGPTTRCVTPIPGEQKKTTPREVAVDPSWRELRISHLTPHLWLSWYPKLQFIACSESLGELIGFTVLSALVNVIVALAVFVVSFQPALGLVVGAVMASYICPSAVPTRYHTRIRRQMNELDAVTRGIHTDCLLNYETVKYFGGQEYQAAETLERRVVIFLNFLNLVQTLIITSGLLVGSLIVALRITRGQSNTSDFVVFITYYAQNLVDTEKLLHLFAEPTEAVDAPDAKELVVDYGEVEFEFGAESRRKPDVVVVSCQSGRNGGKGEKDLTKEEICTEKVCRKLDSNFQWTDVRSMLEFKRTKTRLQLPPSTYEVKDSDPSDQKYMEYRIRNETNDRACRRSYSELTRAIECVQSPGPYTLAGYSYGGVVAFEIGYRLEAVGGEVNAIAFVVGDNVSLSSSGMRNGQDQPTIEDLEERAHGDVVTPIFALEARIRDEARRDALEQAKNAVQAPVNVPSGPAWWSNDVTSLISQFVDNTIARYGTQDIVSRPDFAFQSGGSYQDRKEPYSP